ncbi:hypothetical protein T265_11839 [Opisthorchis viverrini]|uniref:Uncharacterized protein n=1 Tax=Opisthorchis viverrini TaxID=6198 RepID=A0A074ZVZ7_OPIVI|nr:hypothetical protein T265_11839 [Opisthorchis viverrini]KER19364.1 hypothetical protein T265_11839 [Opisthorchis viverrini]
MQGGDALHIAAALSVWSASSGAEGLSRFQAFSGYFRESDLPDTYNHTSIHTFYGPRARVCLLVVDQIAVDLLAELGNWLANVSSPVEETSTQLCTDDVSSTKDETFARQLPSSASRSTAI